MKLCAGVLMVVAACAFDDAEPTGEVESAVSDTQGSDYQGSDYQGSDYQGSDYQGSDYQGSDYQGASYGGTTLGDAASISGTAISIWVPTSSGWEQRFPNRICYWNAERTWMSWCRGVNTTIYQSPLVGTVFTASFKKPMLKWPYYTIVKGQIRIDAVVADTKVAMHPLHGHSSSASCQLVPRGTDGCEHPAGCRRNCDIWLYSLTLIDTSDGDERSFCKGGAQATAVAGTYSSTGQFSASKTKFTFACTGGTIAKCTRWGYRPFGSARKVCSGSSCGTNTTLYALAPKHQACVRAAAADYCSNGTSFTKNGTIIDIYDYEGKPGHWGFIPQTRSAYVIPTATAFVTEGGFDKIGGHQIGDLRYQELTQTSHYGHLETECPGRYYRTSDNDDVLKLEWAREGTYGGWDGESTVWIDSAPFCSHSELTVGKWLHADCNGCTGKLAASSTYRYCTDPTDDRGWDSACVSFAKAACGGTGEPAWLTPHSECAVGVGLYKWATNCTIAVCSTPGYESCCTSGDGMWSSACVSKANLVCGVPGFGNPINGFCSTTDIEAPTDIVVSQ